MISKMMGLKTPGLGTTIYYHQFRDTIFILRNEKKKNNINIKVSQFDMSHDHVNDVSTPVKYE